MILSNILFIVCGLAYQINHCVDLWPRNFSKSYPFINVVYLVIPSNLLSCLIINDPPSYVDEGSFW